MKIKLLFLLFGILLNAQDLQNSTVYVKVVKSDAVFQNVMQKIPHQECHYEDVLVRRHFSQPKEDYSGLGVVLGGIAGGVLGHQIGGGSGKALSTVTGTVLGGVLGGSIANQPSSSHQNTPNSSYKREKVCKTTYIQVMQNTLVGYNNIGYYNGQKIVKFSPTRLENIAITTRVSY